MYETTSDDVCPNPSTSAPGIHYVEMILTIVQGTSFSILHNKTHLGVGMGQKKKRCFKRRGRKQLL